MQDKTADLDAIFGESIAFIHAYTRAQAIADGVLVDVTETAREAGFRLPVAITSTAWAKTVEWSEVDSVRQTPQDEAGRLWDVVWMSYVTARRVNVGCRVTVQLHVVPRGGTGTRPRLTTLSMVIGPGDDGEPVITLMNPDED